MRTTLLNQTVATHLGVNQLSTTMNHEEAAAKGCALQAAMLSSKFKVKEYSVTDILTHPVTINWHSYNDPTDTQEQYANFYEQLPSFCPNVHLCAALLNFSSPTALFLPPNTCRSTAPSANPWKSLPNTPHRSLPTNP